MILLILNLLFKGFFEYTIQVFPVAQSRQCRRPRFNLWVGKIPLEKKIAIYSRTLAWRIPSTEEPEDLWSVELQRVRHNWVTLTLLYLFFSNTTLIYKNLSNYEMEDPLEKEMATHSSTLAWKIPRTEEPGRLQSMGSLRIGHNWATSLFFFIV